MLPALIVLSLISLLVATEGDQTAAPAEPSPANKRLCPFAKARQPAPKAEKSDRIAA